MLRLSNDNLYTGYTDDVLKRINTHCQGKGSRCVRSFPPIRIERVWKVSGKSSALRLESLIKKCTREEKEMFVKRAQSLSAAVRRSGREIGSVKIVRAFTGFNCG